MVLPVRPALIACTRCSADAAPTIELRPHEARYVEAHQEDGEHTPFVCASGHRLLLRTPRAQDASKPTERELQASIARGGLGR